MVFLNKCTYHTQVKNSPKPERREATAREQGSAALPAQGEPARTREKVPARPPRAVTRTPLRPGPGATPGHVPGRACSHAPAAPARKGHEKHSEVLKGRMTGAPEGQGSGRPLLRELWPCAPPFHPPQGHNQFRASVACNPGTRAIQPPECPPVLLLCGRAGQPARGQWERPAVWGGTRVCPVGRPRRTRGEQGTSPSGGVGSGHQPWPRLFKVQERTDAGMRGRGWLEAPGLGQKGSPHLPPPTSHRCLSTVAGKGGPPHLPVRRPWLGCDARTARPLPGQGLHRKLSQACASLETRRPFAETPTRP